MTIENIERIIELLPKNILGSNNKTHHFFYGNGNSLNDIKRNIDDANIIFDDKNDLLIVEINTIINKDDLWKLYQKFEELSSILKVDYDGFEVLIDGEENQQEFLPFEDFFKPLSYFLKKKLPISFCFRLIEDNTTPKQIDEIIVESKSDELSCKSTMQYQVVLSPKGKVKWGHLLPLLIEKTQKKLTLLCHLVHC